MMRRKKPEPVEEIKIAQPDENKPKLRNKPVIQTIPAEMFVPARKNLASPVSPAVVEEIPNNVIQRKHNYSEERNTTTNLKEKLTV